MKVTKVVGVSTTLVNPRPMLSPAVAVKIARLVCDVTLVDNCVVADRASSVFTSRFTLSSNAPVVERRATR